MRRRGLRALWLGGAFVGAALGLAPRAGRGGGPDDDEPPQPPRPCECVAWTEVYDDFTWQCGIGNEFYFKTGKSRTTTADREQLRQQMGEQFCERFFQKLNHNWCVNVNIGADLGQWCYVSNKCEELQGGLQIVGSPFSWKKCNSSNDDAMLRRLDPPSIAAIARQTHVDLALLHKFAYPNSREYLWEDVQSFWEAGSGQPLTSAMRREMQRIASSGRPYSFDTHPDLRPPHMIVVGMTVYRVSTSPELKDNDPGTWQYFECVTRCNERIGSEGSLMLETL